MLENYEKYHLFLVCGVKLLKQPKQTTNSKYEQQKKLY